MKIFLISILFFISSALVFGQKNDCSESGCGDKSQNITVCWGAPTAHGEGLKIRVKGPIENCFNAINNESNNHSYMWHIEVIGLKNVTQDCKLYVTGGDNRVSDYMIPKNEGGNVIADINTVTYFTFSNNKSILLDVRSLNNKTSSNYSNNSNSSNPPSTTSQNSTPTTNQINNAAQSNNNSTNQTVPINVPQIISDPLKPLTQMTTFMAGMSNAADDEKSDSKIQNIELAKLEIEPELNEVNSPEDYKNVSLTSLNCSKFLKLGTVNIRRYAPVGTMVEKVKKKTVSAVQIQAAFYGCNTIFVKVIDVGHEKMGLMNVPAVEIFGFAYSNKEVNFKAIQTLFESKKNFTTKACYSFHDNKISKHYDEGKCKKAVEILEYVLENNIVKVKANVEGQDETSFKIVNLSATSYTLMCENKSKKKLYNYVVNFDN